MADNCAEIAFHYKDRLDKITDENNIETTFTSGIHGQTQKFRRFIARGNFGMFGAYIYPFAISKFFSMPCAKFSNQLPDLESVLGTEGKELEEKIISADDNFQRANILSDFFEKKLLKQQQYSHAVLSSINYIIKTKGKKNIQELANEFCLSTRQFERRFKEFSGFSPKLFSRITRFQSSLDEYGNKKKSLTDIAYDCGYYDQSHFINDFKEFSGYHPSQYFSGQTEGTAWKD
jgi:AraC-like DNA-binding protein